MNDETTGRFKGKYRIPSNRWYGWDYGSNAAYFVTICAKDRQYHFGEIVDGTVYLSSMGQSAYDCWRAIPDHFPFVILDAFVVMPNHVHGIIVINKPSQNVETQDFVFGIDAVETQDFASLRDGRNKFGPQSKNLGSIVRGYKIGVTKFARQNNLPFVWQSRYHDHVIRNPDEHLRIRHYIEQNPAKWEEDDLYRKG